MKKITTALFFFASSIPAVFGAASSEISIPTPERFKQLYETYHAIDFSKPESRDVFSQWFVDLLCFETDIKAAKKRVIGLPTSDFVPSLRSAIVVPGAQVPQTLEYYIAQTDISDLQKIGLFYLNKSYFDAVTLSLYEKAPRTKMQDISAVTFPEMIVNYRFFEIYRDAIKGKQETHLKIKKVETQKQFIFAGRYDAVKAVLKDIRKKTVGKMNSIELKKELGEQDFVMQNMPHNATDKAKLILGLISQQPEPIFSACHAYKCILFKKMEFTFDVFQGFTKGETQKFLSSSHPYIRARMMVDNQISEQKAKDLLESFSKKSAPKKKQAKAPAPKKPQQDPEEQRKKAAALAEKKRLAAEEVERKKEEQRQADRAREAARRGELEQKQAQRQATLRKQKEAEAAKKAAARAALEEAARLKAEAEAQAREVEEARLRAEVEAQAREAEEARLREVAKPKPSVTILQSKGPARSTPTEKKPAPSKRKTVSYKPVIKIEATPGDLVDELQQLRAALAAKEAEAELLRRHNFALSLTNSHLQQDLGFSMGANDQLAQALLQKKRSE